MKYKKVMCTGLREVALAECEMSDSVEPFELIVRAVCSAVSSGTELSIYGQTHRAFSFNEVPAWIRAPVALGYAMAGQVEKAGRETGYREGERVIAICPHGSMGRLDVRNTWQRIQRIPEGVTFEDAALARLACISLVGVRISEVALGQSAAVIGLGPIGHLAGQLLRIAGARPVVGCDLAADRVELARRHKIEAEVSSTDEQIVPILSRLAGGAPEIVIEATGNGKVIPRALELVRTDGRVVLLGSPRTPVELDMYTHVMHKCATIVGAHELSAKRDPRWSTDENLKTCLHYLADGSLGTAGLVSHRVRPEEIPAAYRHLSDRPGDHGCVIFQWG